MRDRHIPPLAPEVLRYFLHYPQAADDCEGVARWRLRPEIGPRDSNDVRDALEWLVAQEFLSCDTARGAGPFFSLNPAKAEEAWRFVDPPDGVTIQ